MKSWRAPTVVRLFGSIVGLLLLLPTLSHAQSDPGALNLTTSPLPISLVAKPGETVSTELRIKNSGTKTETLKVGLMKFSANSEDGKPQLKERETGDDYFDWVSFSQNQFIAQPNEWKTITMTIKLPPSAAFGYYYAVTFSRANSTPSTTQSQSLVGGTATLVLLEAKVPNAKRQVELTSFTATKKGYEFLPVTFNVTLKNTGNIHVAPSGTIYIIKGKTQVDTIPVNVTKGNILPDSKRTFTSLWTKGFPVYEQKEANGSVVQKNGQPVYNLSWKLNEAKNLRFGKYTAHLTVVYDDGVRDVPLDASVSFWVIPWRILIVFVGIPLALIGVIIYLLISRRRYKKRAHGVVRFRK